MEFCRSDLVPRVHLETQVLFRWLDAAQASQRKHVISPPITALHKWQQVEGRETVDDLFYLFLAGSGSVIEVLHISHSRYFSFSTVPSLNLWGFKLCIGTGVAKHAPHASRQPLIWGVTQIITGIAEPPANRSVSFLSKDNQKQRN